MLLSQRHKILFEIRNMIDRSSINAYFDRMNKLSNEDRVRVVACLVEGNSLRATVRMTGIHRTTILKLLVDLPARCARPPAVDDQLADQGYHARRLGQIVACARRSIVS